MIFFSEEEFLERQKEKRKSKSSRTKFRTSTTHYELYRNKALEDLIRKMLDDVLLPIDNLSIHYGEIKGGLNSGYYKYIIKFTNDAIGNSYTIYESIYDPKRVDLYSHLIENMPDELNRIKDEIRNIRKRSIKDHSLYKAVSNRYPNKVTQVYTKLDIELSKYSKMLAGSSKHLISIVKLFDNANTLEYEQLMSLIRLYKDEFENTVSNIIEAIESIEEINEALSGEDERE